MARTVNWKNYEDYISPQYTNTDNHRSLQTIKNEFNSFSNGVISKDFSEGTKKTVEPKHPYQFAGHLGSFLRYLDAAADEYAKALAAFYAEDLLPC